MYRGKDKTSPPNLFPILLQLYPLVNLFRGKTSIRYSKENDGEKRERRREREKGRWRDIEREGEIREREM